MGEIKGGILMRLKKVAALSLAAAMLLGSLTGCGNKKGNDTPSTSNPTADASNPIDVELLVWTPAEDQAEDKGCYIQTVCQKFNEAHPEWNITFTYGVCSEADAGNLVAQDPSASADVYCFANDQLGKLIDANAIAKLGGSVAEYVKSTNSQSMVDTISVNGDVYGVPYEINTWFMFYDKSVFTEEDVKSLDKMLAKAKISFPLTNSWYIASFFVGNGCTFFGDGTDEAAGIDFSGTKASDVTKYLVNLAASPNFLNDAGGAGIAALRDGTVAAYFSGSWDAPNVKTILGENFGVAALPTFTINGEEKQLKSFAGSRAVGVNPNCKYPQVATALAQYLGSEEAQKLHYELRNTVPTNTTLLADAAYTSDPVAVAQQNTFLKTSIIQPFVSRMGYYWATAENFGKAIMSGEVTLENAESKAEDLNTALNTVLE